MNDWFGKRRLSFAAMKVITIPVTPAMTNEIHASCFASAMAKLRGGE
jgi:hypothetical protein